MLVRGLEIRVESFWKSVSGIKVYGLRRGVRLRSSSSEGMKLDSLMVTVLNYPTCLVIHITQRNVNAQSLYTPISLSLYALQKATAVRYLIAYLRYLMLM